MPSIQELETLTQQFPDKAFPRYGLAMEYKKASRWEEAVREFRAAMKLDSNYVAAWFQCGMALEAWGKTDEAKSMYREGLQVAQRVGNAHAASEISAALAALEAASAD